MQKVEGTNKEHEVKIYPMSTCMWCKKTKKLLGDNSVEYEYVDVDLLQGEELDRVRMEAGQYNPRGSYPTIVIDGKTIVGFKETEIMEALGL